MDIRKVKKLIELLEESGISELEISEGEESVRISRHPRAGMQVAAPQAAPMVYAAPAAAPAAAATSAAERAPRNDEHTVTSPMVGTYYASASPGAKPFIEIHLSNVFAREAFRHHSYLSDIAVGCIYGLGPIGYELALQAAVARLT